MKKNRWSDGSRWLAVAACGALWMMSPNSVLAVSESQLKDAILKHQTFQQEELDEMDLNRDNRVDVADLAYLLRIPFASFAVSDFNLVEGQASQIEVTFSEPFTGPLRFRIRGDATVGNDIALGSGITKLPNTEDGETYQIMVTNGVTVSIPLQPVVDDRVEGNESLVLELVDTTLVTGLVGRVCAHQKTVSVGTLRDGSHGSYAGIMIYERQIQEVSSLHWAGSEKVTLVLNEQNGSVVGRFAFLGSAILPATLTMTASKNNGSWTFGGSNNGVLDDNALGRSLTWRFILGPMAEDVNDGSLSGTFTLELTSGVLASTSESQKIVRRGSIRLQSVVRQ